MLLLSWIVDKAVILPMEFMKLNIYQRLRDFEVPAAVLDEIFANTDDLSVLKQSWEELESSGLAGDEIAREVADLIFKEMNVDDAQGSDTEK